MSARPRLLRFAAAATALSLAPPLAIALGSSTPAAAATTTTAWQNGAFSQNIGGIVSRSNVVIGKANTSATQFLPLGNGSLGVAAWAANGFTAQLNRSDTMPYRLSPGQVNIPGLSALTSASNFVGYLDLYNGVLHESGGGMSMTAWIPAAKDELIVDVTGANPGTRVTASVNLWSGRTPTASASGSIASLAQSWSDNSQSGHSNQTFGAMAAITAAGSNVSASVVNSTQVQVAFNPNSDGSYRVIVASPSWTGGNANSTASTLIGTDATAPVSSLLATQSAWWNNYWTNSGLIEANSSDGTAQYLENLHTLYLYFEAGIMHSGQYPGSQAGLADLYNFNQDHQAWYPAGYWLWNLRGQIQANLDSGDFAQNIPIFDMYLNDLPAIESWTSAQMNGKPGACVPETMRFNGNGYYNGGGTNANASCAVASSPSFNAETITSGAEIALWIWQQYQDTGDRSFLSKYYPVLQQTATFLNAWQSVGSDGYLHAVANAHETQWAVQDPTTDIAADQALFTDTVNAATILGTDASLVSQLRSALTHIEPYARTDENSHSQLLGPSADSSGTDVIGNSYQPTAATHNVENLGLEPVWPYGVIGDNTVVSGDNLTALVDRTYQHRQYVNNPDWTYDSIQAARLDMSSEVANDLVASTKSYQVYPSGLAAWNPGTLDEPYLEHDSNVAATLDEALATDYDGTLRFAPAWPSGWDGSGRLYIQGGSKVDVQVEGGTLATAAIEAGSTGTMNVRNPWSGQQAEVVNGSSGAVVVAATTAATLSVPVTAGQTYLVERPSAPTTSLPFAQVTGTPARSYRQLGSVSIGLGGNSLPAGNTVTVTSPGDQSGTAGTPVSAVQVHATDSAASETLTFTAAGLPPGLSISSSGLISGTPTAFGNFSVTVTATDSTGASGSASFTWTVTDATGNSVTVTNPGSQTGTIGTPISGLQLQATDSTPGQTLIYTATGLPPGLSISSSGLITGTPTTAGSFVVTATASDSLGTSGSATFSWTITTGSTGGTCQVSYVKNEWSGGFTANVTVTNTGTSAINGWTLKWTFPGDQKVTNAWNATLTQSGSAATAANVSYNASIAPGGNVQFGFQGTWASNDTSPSAFTLNGSNCN
ncbi:cellulose binding domain-containing protein [Actinocrinis sp.]|uniref:cellulose binding domain-containing protein n=1 Tax=Actinocrinis sp. TaxID=1920516 RepID=UPI002D48B437|nr:cellulose binding domain-containing protein [Actinocrinis sp.]HZP53286.1 cellulose binding domain-containing protein [Actinocrinis sp.]